MPVRRDALTSPVDFLLQPESFHLCDMLPHAHGEIFQPSSRCRRQLALKISAVRVAGLLGGDRRRAILHVVGLASPQLASSVFDAVDGSRVS